MSEIKVDKLGELKAHSGAIYALCEGRGAGTVFSAGADKVVAEWDLKSMQTNPFAIRTEHTVYSLLKSNSTLFIGTITGGIHLIDLEKREELKHLKLHSKGVFHLNATENHLIAASGDGSLSIWSLADLTLLWQRKISSEKIRRTALDQNQDLLAVASGDGNISILETEGFREISNFHAHQDGANSVVFLPNGDLISGGKDAYLRVWSRRDGWKLKKEIPAHNFAIYDLVLTDDREQLISVSRDKTIKVWDANNIETPFRIERKNLRGHINSVNVACWLKEEGILATAGDDRTVMLWNINGRAHGL